MNVLLIGSGGREHAIAWKISQSPLLDKLFIAPGNAGTAQFGTNADLDTTDFDAIGQYCLNHEVNLIIVGPEAPLVNGLYDFLKGHPRYKNIWCFGPSAAAATLEGSKDFAKEFMAQYGIPTAAYRTFTQETLSEALSYIGQLDPPFVLKADGLAAGKGVLILDNEEEAKIAVQEMLQGKFGEASKKVVIEQFLRGIECSVFVITDGKTYKLLPSAKDYKRIGEGDIGLNTGGMGAISPVPFMDNDLMQRVIEKIVSPTVQGLNSRGLDYHGFIFFGLIICEDHPYVIEYNCRLGDPETEVILPRLQSDLLELILNTLKGNLEKAETFFLQEAASTVMLVSGGYPEAYEKGKEIRGLDQAFDAIPFHAGTKLKGNQIVTNGGRVISLTATGANLEEALQKSYLAADQIQWEGKYFRRDIGQDVMSKS